MECPICLDNFNDNDKIKTLSCGHKFHYKCFLSIVSRSSNVFIKCPMCRKVNTDTSKPFDSPEENLKFLSYPLKRCNCKTKTGRRCKNKALLLNYGMCHIHNKDYLSKKYYNLMEEFVFLTLEQRNTIRIRVNVMDVGKKLIMNKIDKNNENPTISDILRYFYEFYSVKNTLPKDSYYNDLYNYYEIEKPPNDWIKMCIDGYYLY